MSAAATPLVRLVHVVGVALVLGSAAFAWATFRAGGPGCVDTDDSTASDGDQTSFTVPYELASWAATGTMVVTGVGNLDALDPPGPSGRWGPLLTAKFLVVTVFVFGSFVRTFVVFRLRRSGPTGLGRSLLVKNYGATAAVLLVPVTLVEVSARE